MAGAYGDIIRALRRQRGWNQTQLANAARVGRELISDAENSGNVGVLNLDRVMAALDSNLSALFGGAAVETWRPAGWARLSAQQRAAVEKYVRHLTEPAA